MKRISLVVGLVSAAARSRPERLRAGNEGFASVLVATPLARSCGCAPAEAGGNSVGAGAGECSALFTDAVAAGLIDAPVKVHVDETTAPVDIVDITPRQNGTLRCVWGWRPSGTADTPRA